ncbi:MAG: putative hydrolase [Phycisphaerales bacterium]|nr:putative hydrolase [Phycisphaerales bacterium]
MPKYRMIAIDLDGTLLSPTGEVTPRVKAAVHRALAAGYLVCFATGRNWTESRAVIDAVAHYSTAVFAGGAMVVDTANGATLHRQLMGPDLARAVSASLEADGHAVLALQDTAAAGGGTDYLVTDGVPLNDATTGWMRATSSTVARAGRLGEHPHPHTARVGIVAAPDASRQARDHLAAAFGDRILCHSLFVPMYAVEVLEVFDPAANKWQGILHVARAHGVEPGEIIAVGDDVNDVPMLRNAGLGVAMGNARPEARAAARMVIGANADEGLAAFLDELVDQKLVEPER